MRQAAAPAGLRMEPCWVQGGRGHLVDLDSGWMAVPCLLEFSCVLSQAISPQDLPRSAGTDLRQKLNLWPPLSPGPSVGAAWAAGASGVFVGGSGGVGFLDTQTPQPTLSQAVQGRGKGPRVRWQMAGCAQGRAGWLPVLHAASLISVLGQAPWCPQRANGSNVSASSGSPCRWQGPRLCGAGDRV